MSDEGNPDSAIRSNTFSADKLERMIDRFDSLASGVEKLIGNIPQAIKDCVNAIQIKPRKNPPSKS